MFRKGENNMPRRILCALMSLCLCLSALPALAQEPNPISTIPYEDVPEPFEGQHHYLLISYDEFRNTDGMMIVTLDTRAKRILSISLSREFLVERPDGKPGRITYITKTYSAEDLCRIVSTHFGIKIEKYFITSFDNVDEMIDTLGGITLTISDSEARYLRVNYEIPSSYTKPKMASGGTYWMCGRCAILYMRMRKGVGGEDGRTERIRKVFDVFVQSYKSIDLNKALELLSVGKSAMIQTNMTAKDFFEALSYAMELRGVKVEGIQMPTSESMSPITYAGMQTRQANFEMCREVLNQLLQATYVVADD